MSVADPHTLLTADCNQRSVIKRVCADIPCQYLIDLHGGPSLLNGTEQVTFPVNDAS